jgi:salicylate hydroxylase/6-hydroxynicotinate 3-monooxygenase
LLQVRHARVVCVSGSQFSIAIVGAGMGGLAAAAALQRFGVDAQVYEQASGFARIGAALQLTPNTMKTARGLGIEQRMLSVGFVPEFAHNRKWDTAEITYLHPMGEHTKARYDANDVMVHRAEVHSALVDLVNPGAIKLNKKLVGVDTGGSQIVLSFADGTRVKVDGLVGADGVNSVVRASAYGVEEPRFIGRVAYRSVYKASRLRGAPVDDRVKWWGPDRHLLSYRVDPRRQEIYFIASVPDPDFDVESWSARGDLDALRAAYAEFHPDARAVLDACPECTKYALVERDPLPSWCVDRIILIGDACHPMLPTMAQGAGSAMEDAVVLARCLQGVDRDGIAEAFRRCEINRKERTARIQKESSVNVWMKTKPDTDWLYGYDAWNVPLK